MNRLTQITAATVVVAGIAGAAFWALTKRGDDTPTYRFATIEQGSIRSTVAASGALSAVQTVEVGTQVSGQVAEIRVDFNDRVKKGQLIARIDPTILEQAVQDAEAGVARAKASLEQAKEEYERTKTLHDEKIVTETEYNSARTTYALAQTSVTSSEIALNRARQNLGYSNIYAPIDGVVIERDIDVGQTVAASMSAPKLFVIANDLSHMRILASVDETDIGEIKEGQDVDFTVQSFQNRQFHGKVDQVRLASTAENNVVSYTVVVDVANPDGALLPGMTATVSFITAQAKNVLTVANTALRFRPPVEEGAAGKGVAGGAAAGDTPSTQAVPQTPRAGGPGGPGGFGGFGGPGAMRAPRQAPDARPSTGTLYTLADDGTLVAHKVQIGISDGTRTEVHGEGISADMQVVIGMNLVGNAAGASGAASNPFQQQQPQGRGPRGLF